MTLKNRLVKLEKQTEQEPRVNLLEARQINYRAGIVHDLPEPPDAIPLRLVEVKHEPKE